MQPHPEGAGFVRAVQKALDDADMAGADIVHVNAHATSTPVGDMAEVVGLRHVLGDHPVLTATKSMTGHLLGAAGALESIATILAIHEGVVPPTINLDDPEDGLPRRGHPQAAPHGDPGRAEQLVRLRRPQRRLDLHENS